MGLEARGNGVYYYRKVRDGSRVRSMYVASGGLAEAFAEIDADQRAARPRRKPKNLDSVACALDASVDRYAAASGLVVRCHLEATGYRRRKRGPWRKKRMNENTPARTDGDPLSHPLAGPMVESARRYELGVPKGRLVPSHMAHSVVEAAVQYWRHVCPDTDPKTLAGIEANFRLDLTRVRIALSGPNPSPLEMLMVERVVVCYAALMAIEGSSAGLPINRDEAGARHVDRLQRRYFDAVRTLAQVRRLKLPPAPLFVGGQHVHIGDGQGPDS